MNGVGDIFGDPIKAPGPAGLNSGTVVESISRAGAFALNFVFVVAGFILAVQLIWGGLDWVTSGGEEQKIAAAQAKIVNSIIGIIIMIAALVIWVFIASTVLGTIKFENGGIRFTLPSINDGSGNGGPGGSNPGGSNPGGDQGGSIQPVDPIFPTGSGRIPRPTVPFN
jgi:hypothetical protein